MKRASRFAITTLLFSMTFAAGMACKKKPATKEEATKQIISDIFDACKAGKSEEAAKRYNDALPEEEKSRRAVDVSTTEGKQRAERLCKDTNTKYAAGYEFGKMETQGEVIGWQVFPKGSNEGQIWAFKEVNGKWTIVDIDPVKRQ